MVDTKLHPRNELIECSQKVLGPSCVETLCPTAVGKAQLGIKDTLR